MVGEKGLEPLRIATLDPKEIARRMTAADFLLAKPMERFCLRRASMKSEARAG